MNNPDTSEIVYSPNVDTSETVYSPNVDLHSFYSSASIVFGAVSLR